MLFRNTELDRAFQFIAESDFDIFCLQEVPEKFLARLKKLPLSVAARTDVERLFPRGVERNFVVILSKHAIEAQGEIPYPDYWAFLPLRTRLFVRLMRPFHFSKIRNRGGLYADVTVDKTAVRIFNVHLILAQPAWRLQEFETAMAARDLARPTIVCGDFNILETRHIAPLNWLLGGKMSDALFHRRERTRIEQRFVEHELANAFSGAVTHPLSQSQLDHILVSRTFSITKADVLPERMGSDHHPLRAEIA